MDAEETGVRQLDRNAEHQTFKGRKGLTRGAATRFSTEVSAVLANTEMPMLPARNYGGQHMEHGVAHRALLFRVERIHGAHQNFERIARNRFVTFVRQSESDASPIRLGSLSDQVPTALKRLYGL